jgi:hypothetical protein
MDFSYTQYTVSEILLEFYMGSYMFIHTDPWNHNLRNDIAIFSKYYVKDCSSSFL